MFEATCGFLMGLSLLLNCRDRRMFALTAMLGLFFFLPAPMDSQWQFYTYCIAAEVAVFFFALKLQSNASGAVMLLCIFLAISHIMAVSLGGYGIFNPYRLIVKILEFLQFSACVALSPVIMSILRNHNVSTQ